MKTTKVCLLCGKSTKRSGYWWKTPQGKYAHDECVREKNRVSQ